MYLNEAQISLTGYVATQPTVRTVTSGASNVTMRVGWTPRRQDRVTGEWTDGNTSYVTVICWRKLATNAAVCLRKGDPVIVKGRLSVRTYEDRQGMQRTAVEVEAATVGHDLSHGVAEFHRVRPRTGLTAAQYAETGDRANGSGPGAAGAADAGGTSGVAGEAGRAVSGGYADEDSAGDAAGEAGLQGAAGLGDAGIPLPSEPMDAADEFADSEPTRADEPELELEPELEPAGAGASF
jgi:single-strand DNA-binding protein